MPAAPTRPRAPIVILLLGGALVASLISTLFWAPSFVVGDVILFGVAMAYFLGLGALILSRVSGNRIGWLFATVGLSIGFSGVMGSLADRGYVAAYAVAGSLWMLWIALSPLLLFWFPTGRAPTRRWRPVEVFLLATAAAVALSALFTESLCQEGDAGGCVTWVDNPIGIPGVPNPEYTDIMGLLLIVGLVVSVAAIAWRYRISGPAERLQLKWFLLATSLFIGSIVAEMAYEAFGMLSPGWVGALNGVAILSIPVAATIAILRYRLYEIDRIISRTVTYALVVGLLAAVVAIVAALAGSQFQEPVVVAATTLGVAAVFNPLRRRTQSWVDHRFNRSRFDAERVMSEFAVSLRDRVDLEDVIRGWERVVGETMQPASSAIWVKP